MIPKGRVTNLSGPLVIDLYLPLAEEVVLCVQVIPSVEDAASVPVVVDTATYFCVVFALEATPNQFAVAGYVRVVQVIPSVEEAACVPLPDLIAT